MSSHASCVFCLDISVSSITRKKVMGEFLWLTEESLTKETIDSIFAARRYASATYAVMRCVCVCVCVYVCVRVSVTFLHSVKTNKPIFKIFSPSGTHTILVFHTKRHDNIPTGIPIECRWGMQKSPFLASIWPHCVLWSVPAASAIDLAATDHGEFITLVAGERPSLLMVGNNDEMYDKKPQRYAEDNVTLRSGKSEA